MRGRNLSSSEVLKLIIRIIACVLDFALCDEDMSDHSCVQLDCMTHTFTLYMRMFYLLYIFFKLSEFTNYKPPKLTNPMFIFFGRRVLRTV